MKSIYIKITIAFISMFFLNNVNAQKFSRLDKSPMDVSSFPLSHRISNKIVKVTYSRPQLNDRKLSDLVTNGKVWRTGANEACEITFYTDVNFGGKDIKKGTYSLFTIPNNKEWTIIISSVINIWGAYSYDEKFDVVRVNAKVENIDEFIEAFSITFDGEAQNFKMYLGWENTTVSVPIKVSM